MTLTREVELGDPRLPDRFWAKVHEDPVMGCWLWTGYVCPDGYARVRDARTPNAHRIAYIDLVADPGDLTLDHLCRVRHCVNPAHLEPVTRAENVRRGRAGEPQRERTHCPHGHEYTPENTYIHPERGHRACQICKRRSRTC